MTDVYVYDAKTGGYVGTIQARIDPLEGKPLLPDQNHASRTTIAPPQVPDGYIAVFEDITQTWYALEDFSGETVYRKQDGTAHLLEAGSEEYPHYGPIPDEYTHTPRPSEVHVWENDQWVGDNELQRLANIDARLTEWNDRLRGKTDIEIINTFNNATAQQKSELLLYLTLIRARQLR